MRVNEVKVLAGPSCDASGAIQFDDIGGKVNILNDGPQLVPPERIITAAMKMYKICVKIKEGTTRAQCRHKIGA